MSQFKSDKMRKFLFAMDQDKQKGIPLKKSIVPKLSSPTANPTVIPPLPALPKVPKFGRTRKYFKKTKGF